MLIYCCNDLIFATKIRSTADALDVVTRPVRNTDMLRARLDQIEDGKPNDPVTAFFLDLDTGDAGLQMLDLIKSHSPSIPVTAFGSHVAAELLQEAKARGADFVMPRSAFTATLPDLISRCKD
ncbi:hypothetical protein [Poriferisphaera sp. WC338]|uniref:hypothetical protein n=1 Tax=Poriferisphaera sp. WC338 TaxID=3425129 RepID=UPI003D81A8CA